MSDKSAAEPHPASRSSNRRVLGLPVPAGTRSPAVKTALLFATLAALLALIAWLDLTPSLKHVRVAVLSGSPTGNYHATVERLAEEVSRRQGQVLNIASAGSVENVQRLIDGSKRCDVHFALVQDGVVYPDASALELIGRLPRPESLVILGRNADRIRSPTDLNGLRLGIGPVGSGTEQLMRKVLAPLSGIELAVFTQPIDQQLDMLERGELDLGAMVIDDQARLVADAVVRRNLQILGIPDAGSLVRRLPFARVGEISAGQMHYVRRLPPENKPVLQVDTLILGNRCASHGATQGLMTAVADLFPTFIPHNRGQPNVSGLPIAPVAKSFYDENGPDLLGKYAPWAVDIMPLPLWIQVFVAFSVLFSVMSLLHRFRLWRLDARRVQIEREIPRLFGPGVTVGDIAEMQPGAKPGMPEIAAEVDTIIERLGELSERCRKQSLSVLVPMGQEMSYRYQETLIADLLHALRLFRERLSR